MCYLHVLFTFLGADMMSAEELRLHQTINVVSATVESLSDTDVLYGRLCDVDPRTDVRDYCKLYVAAVSLVHSRVCARLRQGTMRVRGFSLLPFPPTFPPKLLHLNSHLLALVCDAWN